MNIVGNEYIKFYIIDGILYSEYNENVLVDEEIAKSVVELRHQISNNIRQYWCMDIRGVKSFEKGARDYADQYGQELLHACAVLVDSHLTKFMFNTFLKLKSPHIPMKVFTGKQDAIDWLKSTKAKNEAKG